MPDAGIASSMISKILRWTQACLNRFWRLLTMLVRSATPPHYRSSSPRCTRQYLLDLQECLYPIHAGHPDVHEYQVDISFSSHFDCLEPVFGGYDLPALANQDVLKRRPRSVSSSTTMISRVIYECSLNLTIFWNSDIERSPGKRTYVAAGADRSTMPFDDLLADRQP